jgi:hypothetical protein
MLVFVTFGLGFTAVVTLGLLAGVGRWEVNPLVGMASVYGFLALWTGFAWRMYRTGIYVSDQAVRLVYPWRNRMVAWTDIAAVSSQPAMLGSWETTRDAIFLTLADGTLVETPVQLQGKWFTSGITKNIGPVLGLDDYQATMSFLQSMRAHVTTSSPR